MTLSGSKEVNIPDDRSVKDYCTRSLLRKVALENHAKKTAFVLIAEKCCKKVINKILNFYYIFLFF